MTCSEATSRLVRARLSAGMVISVRERGVSRDGQVECRVRVLVARW